jgi:hypothetical protein
MNITQINTGWWKLVSEGEAETDGLVFFGYSKEEVIGKFASWLRRNDLEKWR